MNYKNSIFCFSSIRFLSIWKIRPKHVGNYSKQLHNLQISRKGTVYNTTKLVVLWTVPFLLISFAHTTGMTFPKKKYDLHFHIYSSSSCSCYCCKTAHGNPDPF